jgi:hypothetical protein
MEHRTLFAAAGFSLIVIAWPLSGPLVAHWGYKTIPVTALAGLVAALSLGINTWDSESTAVAP